MRVCFYAGPGAGKSATAARVYAHLKRKNYSVELIHEYIKTWAYTDRTPQSFDQVYIFGKQMHAEDRVLQAGVDHIVTDSPIMMQIAYCLMYDRPGAIGNIGHAMEFEKKYPTLNIFLDRTGLKYEQEGRYEDKKGAIMMDDRIRALLISHNVPYKVLPTVDFKSIIEYVKSKLSTPV